MLLVFLDLEEGYESRMTFASGLQSKYKMFGMKIEIYKKASHMCPGTFLDLERALLTCSKIKSDVMHSFACEWVFNFDLLLNTVQGIEYDGSSISSWLF